MKKVGFETEAIQEVGDLLKPIKSFPVTKLDDVGGCLKYPGKPKTMEDMNDAIRQGVEETEKFGSGVSRLNMCNRKIRLCFSNIEI